VAYRDATGDNAQLLKRTITGLTDFTGRSRRTEVVYYWIASALVSVVLNFAVSTAVSFSASMLFESTLQILLAIPLFALVVRRLHDQDRSGWWGLLLPMSILLSIPLALERIRGNLAGIVAQQTTPVSIAAGLCGIAVFVFCLLPGTHGANRYGSDPRLDQC
jgi:uncharacterized membrane protein YhaH (DUF805 family)